MPQYYLNKNAQSTGEHEVHQINCYKMPCLQNCIYLGYFSNAIEAVRHAKKYYNNVDGCYYCSSEAHKQ